MAYVDNSTMWALFDNVVEAIPFLLQISHVFIFDKPLKVTATNLIAWKYLNAIELIVLSRSGKWSVQVPKPMSQM